MKNKKHSYGKRGLLKLILFRVEPGYSNHISSRVTKHLRENNLIGHLFWLLGDYDLLLAYYPRSPYPDLALAGTIEHILDSKELVCHDLRTNRTFNPFSHTVFPSKSIGISFIKLDDFAVSQLGVQCEDFLISILEDRKLFKNWIILRSFGWNEVTLLVYDETPSKFIKSMLKLKQLGSEEGYILVDKTISYVGFKYNLFRSTKSLKKSLPEPVQESGSPEIILSIDVACDHESIPEVEKACKILSPGTIGYRETLGLTDLELPLGSKTWGALLSEIQRFRKLAGRHLYSTNVRISAHTDRIEVKNVKIKKKKEKNSSIINLTSQDAEKILHFLGEEHTNTLLNTVYSFNSLIQNDLVSSSFTDLHPYMVSLKDHASKNGSELAKKEIMMMLQNLDIGIEQRALGIIDTSFLSVDNITFHRSGFQRVLQAIELIPCKLAQRFGLHWNGFVTTSMDPGPHAKAGMFSMPVDSLFDIKKWWGLFHEFGHYLQLYHNRRFQYDSPQNEIGKFLIDISNRYHYPQLENLTVQDLVHEVVAEIFAYRYGYLENVDLYFKTSGKFLIEYHQKYHYHAQDVHNSEFRLLLTRLFFVYYIDKHRKSTVSRNMENFDITLEMNLFVRSLKKNGVPLNFLGRENLRHAKGGVQSLFLELEDLPDILWNIFKKLDPDYSKFKQLAHQSECNEIKNTLLKGKLWQNEIAHPSIVLYLLVSHAYEKGGGNIPLECSLATILSFWNTFKLGRHEMHR